jgi:hypothetical protein
LRAYKIAIGILIMQFAIPVAGSLGFTGPLSGQTSITGLLADGMSNPKAWIQIGTALLSIGAASRIFGLQTNLGALVFAGAFTVGSIPLSATLAALVDRGLLLGSIESLIMAIITIVFLFAFIQLASTPAKGAH